MVKSLNDVIPKGDNEGFFKDHKEISKNDVLEKVFLLRGCVKLTNAKGDYLVLGVDFGGESCSFVIGGKVVLNTIGKLLKAQGVLVFENNEEYMFKEPVSVALISTKCKTGDNSYWELIDPEGLAEVVVKD